MPTGKTCGNCYNFLRIKAWGKSRNGMCNMYDYNCHTDSSYAKKCKGYKSVKYKRNKIKINNLEED